MNNRQYPHTRGRRVSDEAVQLAMCTPVRRDSFPRYRSRAAFTMPPRVRLFRIQRHRAAPAPVQRRLSAPETVHRPAVRGDRKVVCLNGTHRRGYRACRLACLDAYRTGKTTVLHLVIEVGKQLSLPTVSREPVLGRRSLLFQPRTGCPEQSRSACTPVGA